MVLLAACLMTLSASAATSDGLDLLPKPVSTTLTGGSLVLKDGCRVSCPDEYKDLGTYVADMLKERTGWRKVRTGSSSGDIVLRKDASVGGSEAYRLTVDSRRVTITASTRSGLLYGVQTLRQLLPVKPSAKVAVPCVDIEDSPRFGWRGLHLDVSRHFYNVAQVKRFLDIMAMYKFNRFHWHLTDDQGWRIEIKSHPELTSVGAWRKGPGFVENQRLGFNNDDGKPYGGFYTQDEIRDVVAYASRLGITVIPEIDLPGHSTAAIAACPQIYCFPEEKMEVRMEGGVSDGVMCAGREETFRLLDDVLDEVIPLFPSEYIHLGGDEAPKVGWRKCPKCQERIKAEGLADESQLQSYFMHRLERYVNAKGRKMIGWDEIMEGGLSPTATVMSWRGVVPGREAAMQGNDVIMTPGAYVYLNHPQSVNPVTRATGDVTNLRKVYEFDPIPDGLTAAQSRHILGMQACQWTEYTPTEAVLYYKEFPRAIAVAETAWSPKDGKNWDDFYSRIQSHLAVFDHYGIRHGQPSYDVRIDFVGSAADGNPSIKFTTEVPSPVHYTTDGTEPGKDSPVFTAPIELTHNTTIKACMFRPDGSQGRVASQSITFHKALGKSVRYILPYSDVHNGGGDLAMTNGMLGKWQGFEKQDADFVVDLGKAQPVDSIVSDWKYDVGDWVLRPLSVAYSVSTDGVNFTDICEERFSNPEGDYGKGILTVAYRKHLDSVRYIRVKAKNEKVNPRWHTSAGGASWIFVDEIRVD